MECTKNCRCGFLNYKIPAPPCYFTCKYPLVIEVHWSFDQEMYTCLIFFSLSVGCKPFLRVYDGLKLIYTSGVL